MRIIKDDTIAVLIDVQEKLFPHMHEKEELEKNLIRLLSGLIILGVPVLFTEQYTKGLGFTIPSLKEVPGINAAIEKQAFSCCDEPAFSTELKSYDRKNVILCGKYQQEWLDYMIKKKAYELIIFQKKVLWQTQTRVETWNFL